MHLKRITTTLAVDSKIDYILGIVTRFRFAGIALTLSLLCFSPAWGQEDTNTPTGSVNVSQVVPEPGSAALLLSAGIVLFVKRSRLWRLPSPKLSSQKTGWGHLSKP